MIKFLISLVSRIVGEDRLLYHAATEFNRKILGLKKYGYLHDEGWIESFKTKTAIDKKGMPIPWLSYPFLDFLTPRLKPEMTIFEYGGGNSTKFFSKRVGQIHTVESDEEWYNFIKTSADKNSHIYFESTSITSEKYVQKPGALKMKFDVIIVDGYFRKECLLYCKDYLKEGGVIVADDTNQTLYGDALSVLENQGFKRLEFWGIASFVIDKKATSVLYRENNCLSI